MTKIVAQAIERARDVVEDAGYELERMIEQSDDLSPGSQARLRKYVKLSKALNKLYTYAAENSL